MLAMSVDVFILFCYLVFKHLPRRLKPRYTLALIIVML